MATEAVSAPVNGTFGHQNAYGSGDQSFNASSSAAQQGDISKEEVAWYFAESYYTTMSRTPDKLYHYFNKRSQFVYGVEGEKSSVAIGIKTIKDRLSDLDYQDCKVRITNIDSQGSDQNIVIQVIGEMSNKSQPHRKFVQTFILAGQTNGYFVLNDIFRFIKEDEEEPETEASGPDAGAATGETLEPAPTATEGVSASTQETVEKEADVVEVDKKLEEVKQEEEPEETTPAPAVNGTPAAEEPDVIEAEEAPAAAVSAPEAQPEESVQADVEPEKPVDPVPSPSPQTSAAPAAPPKPAVPRTWAQLAGSTRGGAAKAAAAQTPAASQPKAAPAPAAAAAASSPVATPSAPASASDSAAAQANPIREPSPTDSKEGSSGGWQMAGADHTRKQSRAQNAPAVNQDGRIRAYVKNVSASLEADALKTHLAKFGELVYFDIARAKNAAFVEYKNVAGFQAAVSANPHRLGGEDVWVEERRVAGPFNNRGGRGGRGNFEGRGASRGSFGGRGRGGNRGGAQAA